MTWQSSWWLPPWSERGELVRHLYRLAGPMGREQALRQAGISTQRLSNLFNELNDPLCFLPMDRAQALIGPLGLPQAEEELLLFMLVGEDNESAIGPIPTYILEEILEQVRNRCRAVPFLLPVEKQVLPAWLLERSGWIPIYARTLLSCGLHTSGDPMEFIEANLHLAHLADRAGLPVSMWVALGVAEHGLMGVKKKQDRRRHRLYIELKISRAALLYNLGDVRGARDCILEARAYLECCREERILLPEDLRSLERRLDLNYLHYSDSPREAEERAAFLIRTKDPLAHFYAIHGKVTVLLRAGASPRDPRSLISPLMEACEDATLPPVLRASCGRRAAEAERAWGDPDAARATAERAFSLCNEYGLVSQRKKLQGAFPDWFPKTGGPFSCS